jgi:hypothetical protein
MSGLLLVPLWKGAKFWTFAFRDGIHLNGLFSKMLIVRMRTYAWEISRKDRVGGRELQFLVFVINTVCWSADLESLPGEGRCFRKLFGKPCKSCG